MNDDTPTSAARWWTASQLRGELDVVVNLVNDARREALLDEERAARKFSDALNRAWNAHARLSAVPAPESDWPLVKALFTSLAAVDAVRLLRSDELRALAEIDPPVLNHRILLTRGHLGSVADVPDAVKREAAGAHLKLRRRLDNLPAEPSEDELRAALVRVADLLYVIRSNLQHGEKFASPDPSRIARDRLVSEKAVNVFDLFFDLLLGQPSHSLVAYGSLAPGGEHHHELEGVGGEWIEASVRGTLEHCTYPRFTPTPAGSALAVQLLRDAPDLPGRWARLDELEGSKYRRQLIPAEPNRGPLLIANVYAAAVS
jgi:hypothetical protein